jgi:small subunit ribosomal protein S2
MAEISMRELLEAGTHFGHQTRRWNPKMRRFIFTERNGVHIIDLQKTVQRIEEACKAVHETTKAGRAVLFVGTKKQAAEVVKQEAERSGQFFVTERWLGGMLTNWQTIRQSIRHLDHLDRLAADGTYDKLKKKEVLLLEKEREKLNGNLVGIRKMGALPGLVYIIDVRKEHIAVKEAAKLGIASIAIVDTNCDPDCVSYPIPGNDDALRSISLITHVVAEAALEGRMASEATRRDSSRGDDDEAAAGHAGPDAATPEPAAAATATA